MNQLIFQLESIVNDICFSGISDSGSDIISRLVEASALCRELDMKLGEKLISELSDKLSSGNNTDTVKILCELSCYVQCLNGVSQ